MNLRGRFGVASLALVPIAIGYALRRGLEPPELTPERFVAERRRDATRKTVVCLGASLVHGRIGASFVERLARRLDASGFQFVNAGTNGDLAYNARQKIDAVVACEPDVVIVLVGSNDVLASLGPRRALGYRLFKRLPEAPDLAWYRENLVALARALRARTNARIAFCSLPTLGERFAGTVNERLAAYNEVIREVVAATGARYIPLHERLDAWLESHGHAEGPPFAHAMAQMLGATIQHYVFGRGWDDIAAAHGYAIFIDGIHVNERGAALIADEIEAFLREVGGRDDREAH